jgi:hypothetical protein
MVASPLDANKKKTNMKVQKIPSSLEDGDAAHVGTWIAHSNFFLYYFKYQTVHLIITKKTNMKVQKTPLVLD